MATNKELESLRALVEELAFWARRYADGRSSYAPSSVNRALDAAKALGCTIEPDAILNDPNYATDGSFGVWRGGRFFKHIPQVSEEPSET